MFKFIFGPTLGYAAGYNYLITVLITIIGMMMSVFLFTFLGTYLREKLLSRFFKNRKRFTKRSRQFVRIWVNYGEKGVAFLTPLILTPIGGTLILAGNNTAKEKILWMMLVSAIFWSFIITGLVYYFGDQFLKFIQ